MCTYWNENNGLDINKDLGVKCEDEKKIFDVMLFWLIILSKNLVGTS